MSAITVRSLPQDVHDGLRALASAQGMSVEALVRGVLAHTASPAEAGKGVSGMSEMQQRWQGPEAAAADEPDLWGALRGTVQVARGTDLAAPLGEAWDAEG